MSGGKRGRVRRERESSSDLQETVIEEFHVLGRQLRRDLRAQFRQLHNDHRVWLRDLRNEFILYASSSDQSASKPTARRSDLHSGRSDVPFAGQLRRTSCDALRDSRNQPVVRPPAARRAAHAPTEEPPVLPSSCNIGTLSGGTGSDPRHDVAKMNLNGSDFTLPGAMANTLDNVSVRRVFAEKEIAIAQTGASAGTGGSCGESDHEDDQEDDQEDEVAVRHTVSSVNRSSMTATNSAEASAMTRRKSFMQVTLQAFTSEESDQKAHSVLEQDNYMLKLEKFREARRSKSATTQGTSWGCVLAVVRSDYFDYFMGFWLLMNCLAIGLQVDYVARNDGSVVPLIELLRDSTELGKMKACDALRNLSLGSEARAATIAKQEDAIPLLVKTWETGGKETKKSASDTLRQLATASPLRLKAIAVAGGAGAL